MKGKTGGGGSAAVLVVGGVLFVLLVCILGAGAAGYLFFVKRAAVADRPLAVTPATSCPPGKSAAAAVEGLVLPDVTGLVGKEGAAEDVRAGHIGRVERLTVLVDKGGSARVEGMDAVGKWRGTNLPDGRHCDPDQLTKTRQLDEIVVYVTNVPSGGVQYQIRNMVFRRVQDLAKHLGQLRSIDSMPVVLDPGLDVPFGSVAAVIATAVNAGLRVEFRPPMDWENPDAPTTPALARAVKEELVRKATERRGPDGISTLGVRIRADARAPWKPVAGVLMACVEARVYRVAFSGMLNGAEVTLGRQEVSKAHPPHLKFEVVHEEFEDGIVEEEIITEIPLGGHKDAISDIPLGGSGVTGLMGVGGGSPATEDVAEAALRWLARHQEPGGEWAPVKWGASKEASEERITALATLAFLGAGHTHKSGKFRDNVRRAVRWLGKQQKNNGSIGEDLFTHALCTWALAESYAMSRKDSLKPGVQRAVDHLLKAQKPCSGWPKTKPDLETTAACVAALKAAKTAGPKIADSSFQGAMAFLNKVTDKQGRCRNRPGDVKVAPSMSAMGASARMLMGMPPTDEAVAGGVKHMLESLPVWNEGGKGVDFVYWYWGTMVAFQTGGDSWNRWNRARRVVLCRRQRRGGPMDGSVKDTDGSWDPVGAGGEKLGRVGSTALATLCLEVYYAYVRVDTK